MTKLLKKTAPLAAVLLAMAGTSVLAQGQMVCGNRDTIVSQLERKYGETRRSMGLQQGRGVVEVFASVETGSWTITVTDARGTMCLMAAGEAFEVEEIAAVETPT